MKLNIFQQFVSKFFGKLGCQIARYPGHFILVPCLLSAICATGLQRLELVTDLDTLYTADGSEAMVNRQFIDNLFPMDYRKNFDVGRVTKLARLGSVVLTLKTEGSFLQESVYQEVKKLDQQIQNITLKYHDDLYEYKDICAKKGGKCFKNVYLTLDKRIRSLENGTDLITYPLYLNNWTYDYKFYAINLGGVTTDNRGNVKSVKAVRLVYYLNNQRPHQEKLALLWEQKLVDTLQGIKSETFNINVVTSTALENEIHRVTIDLVPLYAVAVLIMLCFSVTTTISTDWIESKPWCSIVGSFSSGVAVGASFGFMGYCGLKYVDINIAVPFLMLGIGMDDTFVLLAAWRCTNKEWSVEKRMTQTYENAAISITITSLTNFTSFLMGLTTPFPVVRIFCATAASAVVFTYLFQVTFFGGCLALFGYAEDKKLHSLTFLPIKDKLESKDRNFLFTLLCTGNKNEDTLNKQDGFFMMTWFRDSFGRLLSKTYTKAIILIVFGVYLAIAIWCCTKIKEGMEFQKLAPYDSYVVKGFDVHNEYFSTYRDRIQVVIDKPLDYSDPKVQDQVEELVTRFESSRYISSNKDLTEFWLRYYKRFLSNNRTKLLVENYDLAIKEEFIMWLRRVFLKFTVGDIVRDDVVFAENYTDIKASRFILQSVNVNGVEDDKKMLTELREIAKGAPFPVRVHHPLFVFYDQFFLVRRATFQSVCISAIIMMVITFVFIPTATTVLSVAASIISIEVGVMGYMTLWNVNLDTVSMINLIMCIGFSVDFAAHISHAYDHSDKNSSPNERMRSALYSVGLPIVQGSFSTILAILVLVTAPSYLFIVFFKVIILVIAFAMLHALFLLPVLFSLFGHLVCDKSNETKSEHEVNQPQLISNSIIALSFTTIDKNVLSNNNTRQTDGALNPSYLHDNQFY